MEIESAIILAQFHDRSEKRAIIFEQNDQSGLSIMHGSFLHRIEVSADNIMSIQPKNLPCRIRDVVHRVQTELCDLHFVISSNFLDNYACD